MAACMRNLLSGVRNLLYRGVQLQVTGARPRAPAVATFVSHHSSKGIATLSGSAPLSSVVPHLGPCPGGINRSLLTAESGCIMQQVRTKTRCSMSKGKAATVKPVVHRFMRLQNGLWIRPRITRTKSLWKRTIKKQLDLRQHVICTRAQCQLFDKMTTKYWKEKRHYPNDPYAHYHKRVNMPHEYYKPPKFLP